MFELTNALFVVNCSMKMKRKQFCFLKSEINVFDICSIVQWKWSENNFAFWKVRSMFLMFALFCRTILLFEKWDQCFGYLLYIAEQFCFLKREINVFDVCSILRNNFAFWKVRSLFLIFALFCRMFLIFALFCR